MSESNLITNEINNLESTSRERLKKPEKKKEEKKEENKEKEKEDKFIIESAYLKMVECTAMTLGPEKIYQKCFICPICNPKKNNYICKFCYINCHQKCRDITQIKKKEEDYKGKKNFACFCGNILKHEIKDVKKKEKRMCDLIILDQSLKVGSFFCETHQISICCVCSVECHKKCTIKRNKSNNNKKECVCDGDNHTTYNEIAFTFPLDEYQKLSGISVWPIQILNILFKQKRLENISNLFKAMLNKEEISEEQRKEFFPLLEIFSSTFNRKFKTPYYEEEIFNIFEYKNLVEYIKNIEINNAGMITLKIKLIFILLFVHLKNDFKSTKSLISNDFLCNNLLERIQYRKILMKDTIFNKKLNEKYKIKELIEKDNILKDIILNDVCNLMSIGIDYLNNEENEEDFEICLKIICFWIKKMLFTKEDLIKLINSIYIFFNKFISYINSGKGNIFLLIDLFNGLSELFLMISVAYNDIILMNYLDKYKNISNINNIELNDDFIHVTSEHGTKLFEMIMKSCCLIKKHYDLLNKNEKMIFEKDKKLLKDKMKMEKLNNSKNSSVEIKLPTEGGLFFNKIINLFAESLGIFSLADNIYFKQIEFITKEDLIDYYNFCDIIDTDKSENMGKKEMDTINEIVNNLKLEIESKLLIIFTKSYSIVILFVSFKLISFVFFNTSSIYIFTVTVPFPEIDCIRLVVVGSTLSLYTVSAPTVIFTFTSLATLVVTAFSPSPSVVSSYTTFPPKIDLTFTVSVAFFVSTILFTVIVIVVSSSTSVPASKLCLITVSLSFDVSSSVATTTLNPEFFSFLVASFSDSPKTDGTVIFLTPVLT